MRPHRSLRALLVDVPPAHARIIVRALEEAGWRPRIEHADGPDELAAALQRRGWGAVLYGGDGPAPVPARKALALVRLADPYLPFLAVSPFVREGDLAAVIRGLDGAAAVVPDPAQLPRALTRALDATRLRRRVGGAHHFLLAQQAVTDHVAAGLEPAELVERVLATLGDTLGWSCGAVWRPSADGGELRCAGTWHSPSARPEVVALSEASRTAVFAAGQGLPGRVWAFRRPSWVADVGADGNEPRAGAARRAGLMTAAAFPIALADECAGVIEFFSRGVSEPNPEVAAMLATVGGQLAQYLAGHAGHGARRWLDGAHAPLLALDAEGRVLLANRAASALAGRAEADLLGADWAQAAVPAEERDAVRAAFAEGGRPEHGLGGGDRRVAWQLAPLAGGGAWATGTVRVAEPLEARLRRALAANELQLHYQPVFDLRSGAVVAVEALLRWEDAAPEPAEVVRLAERCGLGDALAEWVLAAVCAQQAAWAAGGLRPHIAFNVAPQRLALVHARLAAGGADLDRLAVDVTDLGPGEQAGHELHALGVDVALDDFGTGSLAGLAGLPVSTLKVDRAFLQPGAEAVLAALLALARALGRTAVAKGLETADQHALLLREGCPLAQGPLLGVPVAPEEVPILKACAPSPRLPA